MICLHFSWTVGFAFNYEDTTTDYLIDPGPQYDADNVWANSTTEGGGERTRTSYAIEFAVPVTASLNYIFSRHDDYDELSTQIGGRRTDQITFHGNY